ncbi:NAD(P)/FAD-dependent oxidoreductase [Radiobacillus sp. PE A8.2]|uniref:NAD(P)/FAD-dependent oxidoreductase n=1 Tax=Radiobacillus sp. PE A8.2 TaxID=3380349 RepID=UPI003890AF25
MIYDCVIIGGGIAGLQAAIQLGRYQHNVLVIDDENGRSNLCRSYHNILGWPDGISGEELRRIGRSQAEKLDIAFHKGTVSEVEKSEKLFEVKVKQGALIKAKQILIATGIMDHIPLLEQLTPCLGVSVYVCPDCDGYEVKGQRTVVLGAGNAGAHMAITLNYWTDQITYINHEQTAVDKELLEQLDILGIEFYNQSISEVACHQGQIGHVELKDHTCITADKGFVAFGGNDVKSTIASKLGVELHHNKHILVNPRTKLTNVENVWAAGDVVAHSEQVTIAMGDGMQAAIWMHKFLLKE